MHGHAPNSIITNQDKAIKNLIKTIFPRMVIVAYSEKGSRKVR